MALEIGIVYALIAAVLGGCSMYAIKRYLSGYGPATIGVVCSAVAATVYSPFVFNAAAEGPLWSTLTGSELAIVVGTALLGGVGFLLFLFALASGDVSYVAPLAKIVPAFVLPIEIVLLQVFLTPLQTAGVVVVTVGLYLTNYQRGPLLEPFRRLLTYRPAQYALASAGIYGLFDVSQRVILQEIGFTPELWVIITQVGIVLTLAPLVLHFGRTAQPIRNRWHGFVLVGTLNAAFAHFTILAFGVLPASVASPIVNAQSVVAVLLGGILLREGSFRPRLLGAFVVVAGITLLVLG